MDEQISDTLWPKIRPLLPAEPDYTLGGRPRVSDRKTLNGILYVLSANIAWNKLPQDLEYGSGMSCWRRLVEWQQVGAWGRVQQILEAELPGGKRINWSRASPKADAPTEAGRDYALDVPNGDARQTFGTWLKEARKALGLTQAELAERVGCALVTLRKYEADKLRPSQQMAEALAAQLTSDRDKQVAISRMARSGVPAEHVDAMRIAERKPAAAPIAANLPIPPTSFVGRTREVAAVQDLLRREDTRLLTLTGPPGIGKTRLALQAANILQDEFADGVIFVSLATVHDPNLVAPTIALVLAVPAVAGQPQLEYLASVIGDKRLLLLLDNFEHVLAAAAFIDDLLRAGPQMKILVASREMLHLYGEREFPVPTLALPGVEDARSVETLVATPAVELFVGRAQAVKPDFELTTRNAHAVAALVACLDGLPLAIELAAARIKLFPPEEMLARLRGDGRPASSLRLLTGGPRNLPPRQQTLRDAIAWSYDLLNPPEQRLFRWLAVFEGGCTLEAVARVCGEAGEDLVERVMSLLDKSLIRRVERAGDGLRLGMLETIREYAHEQLAACGEVTDASQRHALYYAEWAEVVLPQAAASADQDLRVSLHQEHDNVLAALDWTRTQEEKALFQRLFSALWESGQLLPIGAWAAAGWA